MIRSFFTTIFQARKIFLLLALIVFLFGFQGAFSQQDPFTQLWCFFVPSDPNCSPENGNGDGAGDVDGIEKVIREEYKHSPLVPVNTLFSPGTIVLVKQANPFEALLVCSQEDVFGNGVDLLSSSTAEFLADKEFELSVETKAGINKFIEVNGNLGHLNGYKLSLKNPELFVLPDAKVFAEIENQSFSSGCARAVKARTLNNQYEQLTMISSVIKANASYDLDIETNFGAGVEVQLQIAQIIAPKLVTNFTDLTHSSIKGENLYWGVIDDAFLFHALAEKMIASLKSTEESIAIDAPLILEKPKERRLIPLDADVKIILDVPVP